jgi:hypothetical protein
VEELRNFKPNRSTALIQACRQIRHEAQPVFYAKTRFYMGGTFSYLLDMREIRGFALEAIQSIELNDWRIALWHSGGRRSRPISGTAARSNFAKFTSLKHVHVNRSLNMYEEDSKLAADCLFEGMGVKVHLHKFPIMRPKYPK